MPHFTDSVDKIITTYFASVTDVKFQYKGVDYVPKPLYVSPSLLRGFTCPVGCGGCCPRFSLDYLPSEARSERAIKREILFNSRSVEVFSDLQNDHADHFCRNLDKSDGRCGIYLKRPFSCDFELIRFFQSDDSTRLSQQLFGRGWQFLRIDNDRGAKCTMTDTTDETRSEVIRKLNRLQDWTQHFGITTKVPKILNWINSNETWFKLRLEA